MEVWRPILGFDDYHVSSLGRIRSLKRNLKILKPFPRKHGYLCVDLNKKTISIHRLVALTFIPNPQFKTDVNHINGIKTDNRLENLEWATHSENAKHSFRIGTQDNRGEKHPQSLFSNNDIKQIKIMLDGKIKGRDIALKYGVHESTISKIKCKKNWNY